MNVSSEHSAVKLSCQHINELKIYVCKCGQVGELTKILIMVTQCLNAFLHCTERILKLSKAEYTTMLAAQLFLIAKKKKKRRRRRRRKRKGKEKERMLLPSDWKQDDIFIQYCKEGTKVSYVNMDKS